MRSVKSGAVIETMQVKEETQQTLIDEKISISIVFRICPYCVSIEPRKQAAVKIGAMFTNYQCSYCLTQYIDFGNGETATLVSELQVPVAKRKLPKNYDKLFIRAVAGEWYNSINLLSTELEPGTWTMVTEVAAQLSRKASEGSAPNYCLGQYYATGKKVPIEDEKTFVASIRKLKEAGYIHKTP